MPLETHRDEISSILRKLLGWGQSHTSKQITSKHVTSPPKTINMLGPVIKKGGSGRRRKPRWGQVDFREELTFECVLLDEWEFSHGKMGM